MSKLLEDLEQLVHEGVIDTPAADRIKAFYGKDKEPAVNKLTLVFAVVGAMLVGLGILLIVAHNWNQWSNLTRTIVALIPMALAQVLTGYTLLRKARLRAWKETAGILLTLSLGASTITISQIYHLSGSIADFLFNWLIMALPILYLLESVGAAILCLLGITIFTLAPDWMEREPQQHYFWWFTGVTLPLYWLQIKKYPHNNSTLFLHLCYAIMILAVWHVFVSGIDGAYFWQYWLWCIFFLLIGQSLFAQLGVSRNAYLVIGSLGNLWMWTIFSFKEPWEAFMSIANNNQTFLSELHRDYGWLPLLLTAGVSTWMIYQVLNKKRPFRLSYIYFAGALLAILVSKYLWKDFGFYFANIFLVTQALFYILQGNQEKHLGWLNYGLLWLAVWIGCRFFDLNLDYIWRGVLFLILGLAFFAANIYLIRVRKMKIARP